MALFMAWLPSLTHTSIALTPRALRSSQRSRPRLFIFAITYTEREYVPLARFGNAHHGQDRHLASFAVLDHPEVGSRSLGIRVALGKLARLPLLIFVFQGVKHA